MYIPLCLAIGSAVAQFTSFPLSDRRAGPLKSRVGDLQPWNVRAPAEDGALALAILAVVGGYDIEVLHVGTAERDAGYRLGRDFHAAVECAVALEANHLADSRYNCNPNSALGIDRHPVGHSVRQVRKFSPFRNREIGLDLVYPDRARRRVAVVEQFAIGTEAEAVSHFDAFPQLGEGCGRIDPEEEARRRLGLEVEFRDVDAEGAAPDTAVVVGRDIVDAEERLALPFPEDVANLPGRGIPLGERRACDEQSAALIERDSTDHLAIRDERLDRAVGAAAKDAACRAAEVEPVLLVDARAFEQSVSVSERFKLHVLPPSIKVVDTALANP